MISVSGSFAVGPIVQAGASVTAGLSAGGAVAAGSCDGTSATDPHLGHFAFCVASDAGTRSRDVQSGHANSMVLSEGFAFIKVCRFGVKFDANF